jgi:nucleoid-associated protein YgaU
VLDGGGRHQRRARTGASASGSPTSTRPPSRRRGRRGRSSRGPSTYRSAGNPAGNDGARAAKRREGNAAAARAESGARAASYTVQAGDCLWFIAQRQLGEGATDAEVEAEVNRLWERNAASIATGDPNLIHPGQVLRL